MKLGMELELLATAFASELGTVVRVTEPSEVEALRQRLYRARKERPEFQHLSFVTNIDDPTALWIVKAGADHGA